MSRDPLSSLPFSIQHQFVYAENNPVNLTDPQGLDPNKPEPVPLPLAGTKEDKDICLAGWERCMYLDGPLLQIFRPGITRGMISSVCTDFLRRCVNSAATGEFEGFDYEGARNRILSLSIERQKASIWERIRPPRTGSGGLVSSSSKEGGGCGW